MCDNAAANAWEMGLINESSMWSADSFLTATSTADEVVSWSHYWKIIVIVVMSSDIDDKTGAQPIALYGLEMRRHPPYNLRAFHHFGPSGRGYSSQPGRGLYGRKEAWPMAVILLTLAATTDNECGGRRTGLFGLP